MINWRKSSHSGEQGECVELAALPAAIAVRDSKNPDGTRLDLARPALTGLLTRIKSGTLDL